MTTLAVILSFQGCHALEWKSASSLRNGAVVPTCTGQDVTLPWAFTPTAGEHLHDIEWRFSPHGQQTESVIASSIEGNFFAIPSFRRQLTFVPNAGLSLDNVTHLDAGTYSVEVTVNLHGAIVDHTQTAEVVVSDVPVLSGNRLEARVLLAAMFVSGTGEWHVQVQCGRFLSLGRPPVSLVWKTPSGAILPSSSQNGGTFTLNLPNPVEDGVYTCLPENASTSAACVQSDSPLHNGGHVTVNSVQAQFAILQGRLSALEGENTQLNQEVRDVTGELLALRGENARLTAELDNTKGQLNLLLNVSSCEDAARLYSDASGVHTLRVQGTELRVYCDQTTAGGGWAEIQRRMDGSVDFFRNWTAYELGFGDLNGEFWLGLSNIYRLTSSQNYSLRVDMEDFNGTTYYAEYRHFSLAGPEDLYRLSVSGYNGTAGDSLSIHAGRPFTTKDADNDARSDGNCAVLEHGGWWYANCSASNLNGVYRGDPAQAYGYDGVFWYGLGASGLKLVSLKVRPAA